MTFKIIKIRGNWYFKFHTAKSAQAAGWWVEFKYFSMFIGLKSHTLIIEV